jgi:dihydrofolate reductase
MRRVIALSFLSLDGVMESPDKWHFADEGEQQPGKNIAISGSATLVRSLLREGLLDELRLMVHPIVVASGGRLFEDGGDQEALELLDSRTFPGVVSLTDESVGNGHGVRQ